MKTLKGNFVLSIVGMGIIIGSLSHTLGLTTILVAVGFGICIGGIFGAIRILDTKVTKTVATQTQES